MQDIYKCKKDYEFYNCVLNHIDIDFYYKHIFNLHNNSTFSTIMTMKEKGMTVEQAAKRVQMFSFKNLND